MLKRHGTDYEKGEAYLQLSLASLRELATLLESERLSASQKASYIGAYTNSKRLYDETTKIRNELLNQKKSFRKIIINFFVRDSEAKRFHKVSYWSYSSIKSTSDGLNRLLLPEFENRGESAQGNESTTGADPVPEENRSGWCEDVSHVAADTEQKTEVTTSGGKDEEDVRTRSPCDAVEAEDVSLNNQDIKLDLHTAQEVQEAFAIFDQFGSMVSIEEADDDFDDDDGSQTIKPSHSRLPSRSPSLQTINFYITQSVVSFDSESNGTTLNIGRMEGSALHFDTNQPPSS